MFTGRIGYRFKEWKILIGPAGSSYLKPEPFSEHEWIGGNIHDYILESIMNLWINLAPQYVYIITP